MAILNGSELSELRRNCVKKEASIDFDKPKINAALQAIEDWFEANRPALNTAINTATAPYVFTVARKKKLVAFWLLQKFGREGV